MDESTVGRVLHKRGWRKAFTIAEMVDAWGWLVSEIESGYEDVIDEYTNDLSCRNWLHDAWPMLDDAVLAAWSPRVSAFDDRFRSATVDDDGHVMSHFHRVDDRARWWWYRYPRVLVGDLGESLRSVGASGEV